MISRKHVFEEIVNPKKVEESNDNKFIWVAIYKAVYMCLRILLDTRINQVRIAEKLGVKLEGKKIEDEQLQEQPEESDNPVIKDSDDVKAEDEK